MMGRRRGDFYGYAISTVKSRIKMQNRFEIAKQSISKYNMLGCIIFDFNLQAVPSLIFKAYRGILNRNFPNAQSYIREQ